MHRLTAGPGRLIGCVAAALLLVASAPGQRPASERAQRLVIWIVSPELDRSPIPLVAAQRAAAWNPQYQEQTAGSFGQTAGSVGQTAGSTGQTMGNFGQTAGPTGQTAGAAGQTAGSFGRSASTVGRNAGDAGTTMANFGVSTTNLAQAGGNASAPARSDHIPRRTGQWEAFVDSAEHGLPGVTLIFEDVYRNDLEALLEASAGTMRYPDLLVASPLPREWTRSERGLASRFGVASLWNVTRAAQTEATDPRGFRAEAAVLNGAPNPDGARAFAVWVSDRGAGAMPRVVPAPKTAPLAAMAERAVKAVLAGGTPGDADPDMAKANSQAVAATLLSINADAAGAFEVKAETTALRVFDSLAFAAVRAIGVGPKAFGSAHALVVLRKDAQKHWQVLQVSPNLPAEVQERAFGMLASYGDGSGPLGVEGSSALVNEGTRVLGVAQSSPRDGETRAPQPELWWDNLGGASLQIVEWQRGEESMWEGSNLFFVPDNSSRLRTQVSARFAVQGMYRWRVWSLGKGGNLTLSPWRTLTIAGR